MLGERLRAFIDLTRPHGTPIIIGIFLIGVFTGKNDLSLASLIISVTVVFFLKTSGSILNDLTDYELDALDPILSNKPIQLGLIKKYEAWTYFAFCFILGLSISIIFLPLIITLIFLLALAISYIYNIWGKFTPIGFELLFPISMGLLLISGSYVSGGPTNITLLLAVTVLLSNIFIQWINSLRDIECDKKSKVGSIAVLASFDPSDPDRKTRITFIYGYTVWIIYSISMLFPFFLSVISIIYLPFVLIIHSFNTFWVFNKLLKSNSRKSFNKSLVYHAVSCWLPIPFYLMDYAGFLYSWGLLAAVYIGTYFAVAVENTSQYKVTFSNNTELSASSCRDLD